MHSNRGLFFSTCAASKMHLGFRKTDGVHHGSRNSTDRDALCFSFAFFFLKKKPPRCSATWRGCTALKRLRGCPTGMHWDEVMIRRLRALRGYGGQQLMSKTLRDVMSIRFSDRGCDWCAVEVDEGGSVPDTRCFLRVYIVPSNRL